MENCPLSHVNDYESLFSKFFVASNGQRTKKIKIIKWKHLSVTWVNGNVFITRAVICLHGLTPSSFKEFTFSFKDDSPNGC